MKLKIDENLSPQVVPLLHTFGHDAVTVVDEGLAGSDDTTVALAAADEGRMLLTLDRGFGDIRSYPPGEHPGMIVMRLRDQRPALVDATLRTLLAAHNLDELAGCTIIVQANLVRIRWPEPPPEAEISEN